MIILHPFLTFPVAKPLNPVEYLISIKMQLVVKFTFFLLLSKYSLTENTVKIKDILRNSSKMNNKNKTDEYETVQNENGDIFRNEMLKNFRQCVSNDSGNGENDYDENSDTFQRKGKNQYNKSYQSDKPYGMEESIIFHKNMLLSYFL